MLPLPPAQQASRGAPKWSTTRAGTVRTGRKVLVRVLGRRWRWSDRVACPCRSTRGDSEVREAAGERAPACESSGGTGEAWRAASVRAVTASIQPRRSGERRDTKWQNVRRRRRRPLFTDDLLSVIHADRVVEPCMRVENYARNCGGIRQVGKEKSLCRGRGNLPRSTWRLMLRDDCTLAQTHGVPFRFAAANRAKAMKTTPTNTSPPERMPAPIKPVRPALYEMT